MTVSQRVGIIHCTCTFSFQEVTGNHRQCKLSEAQDVDQNQHREEGEIQLFLLI